MSGTSSSADAAWKAMSIVDGSIGTFNYQNTEITGWLCAGSDNGTMNNSSSQGQLFFANFTSLAQIPKGLLINAVTNCHGDEQAVIFDMTQDATRACFNRH